MNVYSAWFNLKAGESDAEFVRHLASYMDHLKRGGKIGSWRLLRQKLGLGPPALREFHLMIEVEGLAQLDAAFAEVSSRAGAVETVHHAVNSRVADAFFALYRDFPDETRRYGEEKF